MATFFRNLLFVMFIGSIFTACDTDDDMTPEFSCGEGQALLFQEANSLLLIEFESATFEEGWAKINNTSSATGEGYMRWEGSDQFSNPGNGMATYQLQINNPGTYRFIWKSAVTEGDNPTEANDSWLRFADADDFYGEKGNGDLVYPGGTGKSPTPEGASKDGWFKVYRSGNPLDFKWQARTSDNDAHDIYVTFDNAGIYTMEVSGRSHGHAIDKFALFQEDAYTVDEVTGASEFSLISCN